MALIDYKCNLFLMSDYIVNNDNECISVNNNCNNNNHNDNIKNK